MPGSFGMLFARVVMKFQDKFTSLQQFNSPNSRDEFQICCIDIYLIRFLVKFAVFLHVFVNFARFCRLTWNSWLSDHAKYQKPWYYEVRHLHYTNWQLEICICLLHVPLIYCPACLCFLYRLLLWFTVILSSYLYFLYTLLSWSRKTPRVCSNYFTQECIN